MGFVVFGGEVFSFGVIVFIAVGVGMSARVRRLWGSTGGIRVSDFTFSVSVVFL